MYDAIIIGAGPAGISAAVYAARKRMDFLVISKNIGGQTLLSSSVENYLSYSSIKGVELVKKFEEHMKEYNIKLKYDKVLSVKKKEKGFVVKTKDKSYETKTVLIASGKKPRLLNVPGEKEFSGKGVTYCATCDAPLFRDKEVAVIGGGNSALDACIQLIKIAKKVYLITTEIRGDAITLEKIKGKAEIITNAEVKEIKGDAMVTGIKIKQKEIAVQGVFIEIGYVPDVDFAKGLVELNNYNEIKINKDNETNIPGIFAAGDVTDVKEKQIVIAAGEGSKALLSLFSYLSKN